MLNLYKKQQQKQRKKKVKKNGCGQTDLPNSIRQKQDKRIHSTYSEQRNINSEGGASKWPKRYGGGELHLLVSNIASRVR